MTQRGHVGESNREALHPRLCLVRCERLKLGSGARDRDSHLSRVFARVERGEVGALGVASAYGSSARRGSSSSHIAFRMAKAQARPRPRTQAKYHMSPFLTAASRPACSFPRIEA